MASWRLTETAEQDIESLLSYLAEHHANRSFRNTVDVDLVLVSAVMHTSRQWSRS